MTAEVRMMAAAVADNPADRAALGALLDAQAEAGLEPLATPPGLKPWWVVTPEYGERMPVCDDGSGPVEYGRDSIEVEAPTRRAAIIAGVKAMRANSGRYRYYRGHCEGNPFAGVRAEPAVCGHGRPHFVFSGGKPVGVECPACEAELAKLCREGQ